MHVYTQLMDILTRARVYCHIHFLGGPHDPRDPHFVAGNTGLGVMGAVGVACFLVKHTIRARMREILVIPTFYVSHLSHLSPTLSDVTLGCGHLGHMGHVFSC